MSSRSRLDELSYRIWELEGRLEDNKRKLASSMGWVVNIIYIFAFADWNWVNQLPNWLLILAAVYYIICMAFFETLLHDMRGYATQIKEIHYRERSKTNNHRVSMFQAFVEGFFVVLAPLLVIYHYFTVSREIRTIEKQYR